MIELLALLGKGRLALVAAVTLGLAHGASNAGLLWLVGDAVAGRANLPASLAAFVAFGVTSLVTRIALLGVTSRLQQGAIFELRGRLGRRIVSTPLRALEEIGGARLQAALNVDIATLNEGLRLLPYFFINVTISAGGLAYLAWLSRPTFLAFVIFGAFGVASYQLPLRRSIALFEQTRHREDALFGHLQSLAAGLKELMLSGPRRAAFFSGHLDDTAGSLRRLHVRSSDIVGVASSWGMFLFFAFIGLLLFVAPQVRHVEARTIAGFTFAVLYLQQPLGSILELLPVLQRGAVALRQIRALDLAPAALVATTGQARDDEAPTGEPAAKPFRGLRLRGVTHTYRREQEDERFSLGPIDLSLAPGQLVFLVGGNGSGKTTLAKLLTGLYAPEAGVVELDGRPVTDATREAYRQHFAAVFSDFHLFDSLLGAPTDPATQALARRYLVRLHLDRKVRIENGRFSTTDLSQGQRKRLALLAAYLDDRPVYVFDEWAADQDPAFKAVFYEELLPELKRAGKAVFVITHDDRYFHLADRVLRLELGALYEPAPTPSPSRPNPPQEHPCPPPPAI